MRALAACKRIARRFVSFDPPANLMKDLEFRIIPKQGRRWMPPAGNRAARHALRNMANFLSERASERQILAGRRRHDLPVIDACPQRRGKKSRASAESSGGLGVIIL